MTDGGEARCDTLRERFLDTVADEVVRSLIARIGRSSVERARDPPDLRTPVFLLHHAIMSDSLSCSNRHKN